MHLIYQTSDQPWLYEWGEPCLKCGHLHIRDANGHHVGRAQNSSDAQLIAAAPELLQAAMLAVYALDHPDSKANALEQLKQAVNKAIEPIGGVGYSDRHLLEPHPKPQERNFGFVVFLPDGSYMGADGLATDLDHAWTCDEYEEAQVKIATSANIAYIAEYLVVNGKRELAYETEPAPEEI